MTFPYKHPELMPPAPVHEVPYPTDEEMKRNRVLIEECRTIFEEAKFTPQQIEELVILCKPELIRKLIVTMDRLLEDDFTPTNIMDGLRRTRPLLDNVLDILVDEIRGIFPAGQRSNPQKAGTAKRQRAAEQELD